jgi:60 kDa SS-A/Ro ribonucleoprotein
VPTVVDELDEAFYTAYQNVDPTGKRFLVWVEVSGSMEISALGLPLSACEIATAMAMVTVSVEPEVMTMAFADAFRKLLLSRRMWLDDALKHTRRQNFGGTDCALPMSYALKNRIPVDVFVVYTDSETWFGNQHPTQTLSK